MGVGSLVADAQRLLGLGGGDARDLSLAQSEKATEAGAAGTAAALAEAAAAREALLSSAFWLFMYFAANVGLTLYNKAVLELTGFHFPWALTAVHTLASGIGALALALARDGWRAQRAVRSATGVLLAFSFLYTINIAVSNVSLNMVTLPFHQIVRSTTPVFAVGLAYVMQGKTHSYQTYLSLVPVVLGVAIATLGDISFTFMGFVLTILGTLLAALKTVVTNLVQVGPLKMDSVSLLWRLSLLAFLQTSAISVLSGELDEVRARLDEADRQQVLYILVGNGITAFILNVVSFTANGKTSALTMTVAANVKQVLVIGLSIIIFAVPVTLLNATGIFITLAGGAMYTLSELREKQARR